MLEDIKPSLSENVGEYHYLLKTPFRYPPLKWGSRFGRIHETGIFYGGCSINATLAESAYYRFVFWFSMDAKPVKDKIRSEHTLFSVGYQTIRGVRLQNEPFNQYVSELTHPKDYIQTQQLGTAMREAGIEAFEYQSARDPDNGICVALFTPESFRQKQPDYTNQWLCEVSAESVSFKQIGLKAVTNYYLEDFLFEKKFPTPG